MGHQMVLSTGPLQYAHEPESKFLKRVYIADYAGECLWGFLRGMLGV